MLLAEALVLLKPKFELKNQKDGLSVWLTVRQMHELALQYYAVATSD